MWRLVLLFTVVPAVELYLLLQLGSWLGPLQTVLLILLTGFAGAWLAKREGFGLMAELRAELAQGLPPGSRLAEGFLVLVGAVLLITPGILTDLTGFLFIAPPSRRWLAPRVVAALAARFDVVSVGPDANPARPPRSRPRPREVERGETPFSSPFDDLP